MSEWLGSLLVKRPQKAEEEKREEDRQVACYTWQFQNACPAPLKGPASWLPIDALENNQAEQDAFLSIYHAATHTFSSTATLKIIENNLGKAFIKMGGRAC